MRPPVNADCRLQEFNVTQPSFRRYVLSVAAVVVVASLGAVFLVDLPISRTRADSGSKGAPPPPVAVSVAAVEAKEALTWDEFSGRLEAIERVDVPVRMEKRLAALLEELAKRKGMSVSSALEETLLHTFEPLGDGVASPHTGSDLRYIQELKRKHGIDYDCHASYRFVER